MAEDRMMTAGDVVAELMGGEHGDLLRDAIALIVRELMDAEISAEVGAGHGERSPERVTRLPFGVAEQQVRATDSSDG
jgi:transposase-like protein